MRHVFRSSVCIALVLFASVSGCASQNALIDSFETLTNETEKTGVLQVPQTLMVAVNGMLPQAESGMVFRYKHSRSTGTAIGLSPDQSYKLISTIQGCLEGCPVEVPVAQFDPDRAAKRRLAKSKSAIAGAIRRGLKALQDELGPEI